MNIGELLQKQLEKKHIDSLNYDSIIKNTIVEYFLKNWEVDVSQDIVQSHYKNRYIFVKLERKILGEEIKNVETQLIQEIEKKLQKFNQHIHIKHIIVK